MKGREKVLREESHDLKLAGCWMKGRLGVKGLSREGGWGGGETGRWSKKKGWVG